MAARLLVLMYHRARAGRFGNAPAMLDAHFAHIAREFNVVTPGANLDPQRLNVCLSFDDGYFDFYALVYPLLLKHRLRALLAVPPDLIASHVDSTPAARLRVEVDEAFADHRREAFCTWSELRTMAQSEQVEIAAHGYSHVRLDRPDAALATEIHLPQTVLEAELQRPVTAFVYPYGRYSAEAQRRAAGRYRHVFRIGGALNRGWSRGVLYRVDADQMASPTDLFAPARLLRYDVRRLWNRLRGR